jgi:hypothetical protein
MPDARPPASGQLSALSPQFRSPQFRHSDVLTAVPALGNVMRQAGEDGAGEAGHGAKHSRPFAEKGSVPFLIKSKSIPRPLLDANNPETDLRVATALTPIFIPFSVP